MIKLDIEMPVYCSDCPCHDGENGRCKITRESAYDKRPFDCPLKEEKHGKWIINKEGTYGVCSLCLHTELPQYDGVEPIPNLPPYCSMCGAKMDKEEEE